MAGKVSKVLPCERMDRKEVTKKYERKEYKKLREVTMTLDLKRMKVLVKYSGVPRCSDHIFYKPIF